MGAALAGNARSAALPLGRRRCPSSPTAGVLPFLTRARRRQGKMGAGVPLSGFACVRAAINDLASKRKLAPESVQVVLVQAVDWPDTSLGCPQPGMLRGFISEEIGKLSVVGVG